MHIDYKHRSNIKKLEITYDRYIKDDYISDLLNPAVDDLIYSDYDNDNNDDWDWWIVKVIKFLSPFDYFF